MRRFLVLPLFRRLFLHGAAVALSSITIWTLMPVAGSAAATRIWPALPIPRGYFVAERSTPLEGVERYTLISFVPRRVVNIAVLRRGAAAHLRAVVSNETIKGGRETVASMCVRVHCALAVNGDFFSLGSGEPSGGVAFEGIPARSPRARRYHLGQDAAGNVAIRIISMGVAFTPDQTAQASQPLTTPKLNVSRGADDLVLYTDRWAATTQTGSGFEIVLQSLAGETLLMGRPIHVTMIRGAARGGTPIPAGAMVLSGSGTQAQALAKVWSDASAGRTTKAATLRIDSRPQLETFVGGSPPLLLRGAPALASRSNFATRSTARTFVGKTPAGDTLLVEADVNRVSIGMSLYDAMRFARSIGAVDALNLDGGGSSQFVENGVLLSTSPNLAERPVATALAIVANAP